MWKARWSERRKTHNSVINQAKEIMDNIKMCIEEIKVLLLTKTQKISNEGKYFWIKMFIRRLFSCFRRREGRDIRWCVSFVATHKFEWWQNENEAWILLVDWSFSEILMKFHVDVCREISRRFRLTWKEKKKKAC